jgi:hypothetical protein
MSTDSLDEPWHLLTAGDQARLVQARILELEMEAYSEMIRAAELEETESPVAGSPQVTAQAAGHRVQARVLRARAELLHGFLT